MSSTDNKTARKYSNFKPISSKTMVKYMEAIQPKIENIMREKLNQLPVKRVGLIFDGWSCEGDHYTGIFITFCETIKGVVYNRQWFLCMGVQDDSKLQEVDFTAA